MSVTAKRTSITEIKAEAIVNAANGCGIMGKGIAGAIAKAGGSEIQAEARALHNQKGSPFEPGEVYVTTSGDLEATGIKKVIHAVTMKFPGQSASINDVVNVTQNAIEAAIKLGFTSIAFPGLGTGIGRLDKETVALRMTMVANNYGYLIDIIFVDLDQEFIKHVEKHLV